MLISFEKQFIFIRVPKAAGTSIENALELFVPHPVRELLQWHCLAKDLKSIIQSWERYFRFGFVRNPWDAQVSMYFYVVQMGQRHPEWLVVSAYESFQEYIDRHMQPAWERGLVRTQRDFLFDPDGRCLMNFIGRFENLHSDFQLVCEQLELGHIKLAHKNSSIHRAYQEHYNSRTKELVQRIFYNDIATFGYRF